nr:APN5 [Athetis lepigone]
MRFTSVILLALAAVIVADSPLPLDVEEEPATNNAASNEYRLPDEDLDPEHYDVEVTPYFPGDPETAKIWSFDGKVSITVKAKRAGVNVLTIHSNVRLVESVSLQTAAGVNVALNANNPFEEDRIHQFLKINLPTGAALENEGRYILTINYVGNINETPLSRGVFRGNYKDDQGVTHWYLATHLQPTHSRQAFPSFDEPGFKSTFKIIINRPASFSESFSNMHIVDRAEVGNRVREVFANTPRMSAYLVTFHVHDGFTVIADNHNVHRPYRILARSNATGQGEYAQEIGPPLTNWLSAYFSIDYYSMNKDGVMKNDQIASPYWASGATENWGLVTYRELRLLYEEGETNALDKLSIGTITAHELAHKWFGNLVTARWWDNVWINEGFASYFEYFAMHGEYPELELEDQFNVMYLQSALSADSGTSTRALQHTVNSPTEVTSHFQGISYSKGASLLLMLKHYLSEDTFKKALNYFLVENSYQHAFPADLGSAFAKAVSEDLPNSNIDIAAFIKYWVEEEGYPVLNVAVNSQTGRIDLSQERFFVSASATPTTQAWPLPLTYTTQSNPNWENLPHSKLMTQSTDFIENAGGTGWVIFNVQQKGIYRVNYNPENWQLIANALDADYTNIHHLNRAQIVDDVFALMRSNRMTYDLGFRVLQFLKKDTSFYSWYPAISGFNWLRNRFLHLPEILAVFDQVVFGFLDAVIADVGYSVVPNEKLTTTMKRFHVLSFACNIGHRGCVDDSVAKFNNLFNNVVSVNPNLRRHVFCEGLRAGGYNEWKFLHDRRSRSNNQADEVVMLRALGCTTNNQARDQYLQDILNDDVVKAQDRVNAFNFFYMGHRSNANYALQFLKDNIAAIRTAVVLPAWFNNVLSNIAGYLDTDGLLEMEAWLNANQGDIPEYEHGIIAINSARSSMEWGSDNADSIITAIDDTTTTEEPTTTTESTSEPTTTPPTTPPTTEPTTAPTTTEDPGNSAAVFMPTIMLMLWTALAMLLK